MGEGEPEVLMAKEDNPRWQMNQKKARYGYDENGKELSKLKFSISALHLLRLSLINSMRILHWIASR